MTVSESMSIDDYLAQGGKLTSPGNVSPRYRGELLRIMSSFADSMLAGSAGFADAINTAPGIRERIAASRIVMEKADHAGRVLELMGDFGTDTRRYEGSHDWAARGPRDADVGARRLGGDMRLSVFHYPLLGWSDAVVMNVLMGLATDVQIGEMVTCSYAPFAEVLREIAPLEARHAESGMIALRRIAETENGRSEARASLDYWRPKVAQTFGQANSARFEKLARMGLRHQTNEAMLANWNGQVDAELKALALA